MSYLYSVRDKRTIFQAPFMAMNDDAACRFFEVLIRDKSTLTGMFPSDYELYSVGTFNETTGLVEATTAGVPIKLFDGGDFQ